MKKKQPTDRSVKATLEKVQTRTREKDVLETIYQLPASTEPGAAGSRRSALAGAYVKVGEHKLVTKGTGRDIDCRIGDIHLARSIDTERIIVLQLSGEAEVSREVRQRPKRGACECLSQRP